MQNEILKPVLDTDEVAVPRYDIVGPNGSVIQQNVELRLKNEVVQEGTPYDEESVLPTSLREQLELPKSATPAEAFLQMLKVSGGAVARNRAPTTTDAQPAGKIWIVPKMVFHNQMPNALAQVASNWQCTAATVAVSGNKITVTGNGEAATLIAEAPMLTAARAADLLYVTADVAVLDDANSVTIELVCDDNVVAMQSLNVPTAGDTMTLTARAPAGVSAVPMLRVTSVYNTPAAQSGKRVSVEAITVWNLTADMCQISPDLEFTQAEATAYLEHYGPFQTREYELSTLWWYCLGLFDDNYVWQLSQAPLEEARQALSAEDTTFLKLDGSRQMLAELKLHGDPTDPLSAVPKQYVDAVAPYEWTQVGTGTIASKANFPKTILTDAQVAQYGFDAVLYKLSGTFKTKQTNDSACPGISIGSANQPYGDAGPYIVATKLGAPAATYTFSEGYSMGLTACVRQWNGSSFPAGVFSVGVTREGGLGSAANPFQFCLSVAEYFNSASLNYTIWGGKLRNKPY